ncbi:MAG: hypothetical protein ACOC7V_12020 [Spirochaetota bacterium]
MKRGVEQSVGDDGVNRRDEPVSPALPAVMDDRGNLVDRRLKLGEQCLDVGDTIELGENGWMRIAEYR